MFCFVALQLEKTHNLLENKSLCIFLISKKLWLCRGMLYCGTLQTMYPGNSTCICTEPPNKISITQFTESVHASVFRLL